MTTQHITPTIGRTVYYRGIDGITRPAIVTAVHSLFSVNLHVFGSAAIDPVMTGMHEAVTHADPEQDPSCLNSWHWMPYQKEQAAKSAIAAGALDLAGLRRQCLEMALHSTDGKYHDKGIIGAAEEYMAYIQHGTVPGKE